MSGAVNGPTRQESRANGTRDESGTNATRDESGANATRDESRPQGARTPDTPLLTPAQASKLLEEVVYERVVSCIDFDALFELEQELWSALDDLDEDLVVDEDRVVDVAGELIGNALARVREDPRRWADFGPAALDDDCPLCQDVAAELKAQAARRSEKARKPRS